MLNYLFKVYTQCVSDALVVITFCVSEKHIEERRKMMWLFTLSGENSNIKHALLLVTHPHDSSGKCNYDASEIGRASYQKIIKNSKRSCVRVPCVSRWCDNLVYQLIELRTRGLVATAPSEIISELRTRASFEQGCYYFP